MSQYNGSRVPFSAQGVQVIPSSLGEHCVSRPFEGVPINPEREMYTLWKHSCDFGRK